MNDSHEKEFSSMAYVTLRIDCSSHDSTIAP